MAISKNPIDPKDILRDMKDFENFISETHLGERIGKYRKAHKITEPDDHGKK